MNLSNKTIYKSKKIKNVFNFLNMKIVCTGGILMGFSWTE